jgi:hypothetical protein
MNESFMSDADISVRRRAASMPSMVSRIAGYGLCRRPDLRGTVESIDAAHRGGDRRSRWWFATIDSIDSASNARGEPGA